MYSDGWFAGFRQNHDFGQNRQPAEEQKESHAGFVGHLSPGRAGQLAQLAEQTGVYALPVIKGEKPAETTRRAISEGKRAALTLLFWTPPVVCTLTKS